MTDACANFFFLLFFIPIPDLELSSQRAALAGSADDWRAISFSRALFAAYSVARDYQGDLFEIGIRAKVVDGHDKGLGSRVYGNRMGHHRVNRRSFYQLLAKQESLVHSLDGNEQPIVNGCSVNPGPGRDQEAQTGFGNGPAGSGSVSEFTIWSKPDEMSSDLSEPPLDRREYQQESNAKGVAGEGPPTLKSVNGREEDGSSEKYMARNTFPNFSDCPGQTAHTSTRFDLICIAIHSKRTKKLLAGTAAPEKRLRFKTTTDASEKQVIEAMQKIASHIKNPSKFTKASKLAIQLIQAGSVKEETSDYFFSILESSMSSIKNCNEPSVRADYHALFSAAQDVAECLKMEQRKLLSTWTIRAVCANDLFTDDSFVVAQTFLSTFHLHAPSSLLILPIADSSTRHVHSSGFVHLAPSISIHSFSKVTGRIKDLILTLPLATKEDDAEEAVALKNEAGELNADGQLNKELSPVTFNEEADDPYGLDALISKEEKTNRKKVPLSNSVKDDEQQSRRLLKLQREALVSCLEIAAKRYKTPWCQTTIDILAKHAFDNIARFTTQQRDAISKLWASIREQQTHRKQGKSVSGKLDVNAFEWLQHNVMILPLLCLGGQERVARKYNVLPGPRSSSTRRDGFRSSDLDLSGSHSNDSINQAFDDHIRSPFVGRALAFPERVGPSRGLRENPEGKVDWDELQQA
ncbi:aldolase-type TIM barrel family protein [Striga asiatica]|uniref:Aldolase-type TIM barrel family protein n=1 Tax=Striga asiatica TaxID=4170 RepID=A0A5A7PZ06_STRAF|nr:aldolase-type TIM barrel family protein [Striga asiatica]